MRHILRSGFRMLALFGYFAGLARLSLAEIVLITQISPILLPIAAVIILSERLTIWRMGWLAFGFAGVVVFVWPEFNESSNPNRLIGYMIDIISAIFTALALLMVRRLNKTETPGPIAFYFALTSSFAGLLTLPWGWVLPNAETLLLLFASGLFGGFAHIATPKPLGLHHLSM